MYFGNCTRAAYVDQTRDEQLAKKALSASRKPSLHYEYGFTAYGGLQGNLKDRSGANLTVG